jgi:hypothetical protein
MIGKRRVRIKTHADYGVGIGARYGLILSNRRQIIDFPMRIKSERFGGFSG